MFMYKSLCMYVCIFCIYHSRAMQRFKLVMADKIADIDNSVNAISTKVTDIGSSLDKNI